MTQTEIIVAGIARVVRGFLRDDDVVGMALLDRGGGDLDEAGPGPELFDGTGTTIAHAGPQAADELEDEVGQRPLVGNAPLDPLGDELLGRSGLVLLVLEPGRGLLAITFVRALGHGPDRAHAAI